LKSEISAETSLKRRATVNKSYSIKLGLGLVAVAVLGAALPASAKGASGPPTGCSGPGGKSFNVTSIIANTDSNSLPFQLQSDGQGAYTSYKNSRTDSATSDVQANTCDWVLDLSNSKLRTVKLSLAYPASNGAALPAGWPTDGSPVSIPALVMTNCAKNSLNNGIGFGDMTYFGQTLQCGFHVTFYSQGIQYSLRMNPSVWAGATWAQVTCTGAASNQCNTWTVTPIPNIVTNPSTGQNSGIGELVQPSCDGCDGGTPLGLYYVSFSATITKP
jgi:hypothetical protein